MPEPIVYLINLARSPDRLAATGKRLDELGLKWERIEAVDGRAFGDLPWPHFDEFAYRHFWGKRPHPNELGCYLSHYAAMKTFLNSEHEFAVILEDDAALADDVPDLLRELVDNSDRWDVVKLDSRHWGAPVPTLSLRNGRRLVAYTQRSTGSAGYMLNRKAAESYVRKLLPMKVPYDHAFDQVWRYGLRMRGVMPRPAKPESFASDIGYTAQEGSAVAVKRKLVAPVYRACIEVARVLYYLAFDPVWFEWLTGEAFRSKKSTRPRLRRL